jgi:hypothetical protein
VGGLGGAGTGFLGGPNLIGQGRKLIKTAPDAARGVASMLGLGR